MKAVVARRYGPPAALELREVDRPRPSEREVLVRVRAASLHPDVWHAVTGRPWVLRLMGAGLLRPDPSIPGTDMAGTVEAVGANVARLRPGDDVFGETARHSWLHGGAFAEYVTVPEEWLAIKPPQVGFERAASVPTSGLVALQNLRDTSRTGPGKRVIVNGAGGGVGSLALQIAKSRGAHVTAVDSAGKQDLLRQLGADEVLDYRREDFTRRGVRYDLVFDVPGRRPFGDFAPALEPDGRYVPIGHENYGAHGKRVFGIFPHFFMLMIRSRSTQQLRGPGTALPGKAEAIEVLRGMLDAGTIAPIVDRAYPIGDVVEAFRHLIEDEPCGKVVLVIP